jgi:hypothetical protein
MGLQLTSSEQVLALAPDASSASAGKKLNNTKHWQNLGQNPEALWGECQGSALYQVRVDLATLTITCSCPSRKLPCKHALGLLLLAVDSAHIVPTKEPPEWITSWLAKRAASSKRKETKEPGETKEAPKSASTAPSPAQLKTLEKRVTRMIKGLDTLDLWLNDLIRNGLASIETQPPKFWEAQAAHMVDAQLPGIATRLRIMADIPNSSPDWPTKLLSEMGKLALLSHAFRRREHLDTALQTDIRQLVGWPIDQEEISARGETVTDDWLILGQRVNDTEKVREQWTWLLGQHTKRPALILQFAFSQTPFAEVFPLGVRQTADLTFWPAAYPLRARVETRRGAISTLTETLPGIETIEDFLRQVANALARNPWQEHFLCVLNNATPFCTDKGTRWYIRDQQGAILPLSTGEHWNILALTGGYAIDFVGAWNGNALRPLGMLVAHTYHLL